MKNKHVYLAQIPDKDECIACSGEDKSIFRWLTRPEHEYQIELSLNGKGILRAQLASPDANKPVDKDLIDTFGVSLVKLNYCPLCGRKLWEGEQTKADNSDENYEDAKYRCDECDEWRAALVKYNCGALVCGSCAVLR